MDQHKYEITFTRVEGHPDMSRVGHYLKSERMMSVLKEFAERDGWTVELKEITVPPAEVKEN